MKKVYLSFFFSLLILLSLLSVVSAADPLPYLEFVKFTTLALNALDGLEAAALECQFSKFVQSLDQNSARLSLRVALKKYDRYVPGAWPEDSNQGVIVRKITETMLNYDSFFLSQSEDTYKKAYFAGQEAREMFLKYKKDASNLK
ncbi:MAG: hypothetical protein NT096_12520 [Proteobacteria bacterium]|nr:hypothetical protein [Pseudomonadota bacterium]